MRRMKKVLAGMAAFVLLCGIVSVTGVSAYTCPYDCDVNQDGTVNILDSIMFNQYLTGRFYVSDPSVMDVNGNFLIDIQDTKCILAHTIKASYTCVYV